MSEMLVPREPTREMWAAGGDAVVRTGWVHHDRIVEAVWQAMLNAAPPGTALASADAAGFARGLEVAARVAVWAHMVPPDGGSPTAAEQAVAEEAARRIRALADAQPPIVYYQSRVLPPPPDQPPSGEGEVERG